MVGSLPLTASNMAMHAQWKSFMASPLMDCQKGLHLHFSALLDLHGSSFFMGLCYKGQWRGRGEVQSGRMDRSLRHGQSASFVTQANALLRKNLTMQKRNMCTNISLVLFPALVCLLLYGIQSTVNSAISSINAKEGPCNEDFNGIPTCAISSPQKWPVLLQIPELHSRATKSRSNLSLGLPPESCKKTASCPVTVLLTGDNRSLAESVGRNMFVNTPFLINSTVNLNASVDYLLGTDLGLPSSYFVETAFTSSNLYNIQPRCLPKSTFTLSFEIDGRPSTLAVHCVEGLYLWRESYVDINNELYSGYPDGNHEKQVNGFIAAYDFLNTSGNHFNVIASYDSSKGTPRISRLLNMASNSYLQFLKGASMKVMAEFVMEMPKGQTPQKELDTSSLFGPLLYTWVIELLFPVILIYLVYEKQQKLRTIMSMHGLGNKAFWAVSYSYFLVLSSAYLFCFILFGIILGLGSSMLNDYSVQFAFYFVYINLQISLAFFASTMFTQVKTASVAAYIYVFASGLLGYKFFQKIVQDTGFPRWMVLAMEIVPAFSLYGGLYELSDYSSSAQLFSIPGMTWKDVYTRKDGMRAVLIIMVVEWIVLLPTAYYLDNISSFGDRDRSCFQLFSSFSCWRRPSSLEKVQENERHDASVDMERPDILCERKIVDNLLQHNNKRHPIICDNLKKIYPGEDGNPDKYAVKGLSLAVSAGECLGILGPNGAGKTSVINMITGLISPTSGSAFINGLDITTHMEKVHSSMGVCPQHDLIWEVLTGREHLLFYGRLKNLKGHELTRAVEESLTRVKLNDDGVPDKQARTYSGGMQRRLSVAISLIGNPQCVYMDEPSTGLDPASRNMLWEAVKQAKRDKAIILTTHSMEEAEVLCDRIGIFVNGQLQCLGNPVELKSRYGGHYMFTITTSANVEREVDNLVQQLFPNAVKTYHISGTQKFELPKAEVTISDVFRMIQFAKRKIEIQAWGLADSTLEDVFITVAKKADAIDEP